MLHESTHGSREMSQAQPDDTPLAYQPHQSPAFIDPTVSSSSTDMTRNRTHSKSGSSSSFRAPSYSRGDSGDRDAPSGNGMEAYSNTGPPGRPVRNRARSTSSSMLARLTSRSSSYNTDLGEPLSPTSTRGSNSSPAKPKLDRAALARPKGKYKSGVNFKASPMNFAAGDEPFMEQISPSYEKTEEETLATMKEYELEEMVASGSTKAALARALSSSIGDPIFATHQRALAEASAKAASASAVAPRPTHRMKSASQQPSTRSPNETGRPSNLRFSSGEMNEITEDAASKSGSHEDTPIRAGHGLLSEAAEVVLASAKKAASSSENALKTTEVAPDSTTLSPSIDGEEPKASSQVTKRRTFLTFGGGNGSAGKEKKEKKKGKLKGLKGKSSTVDDTNDGAEQDDTVLAELGDEMTEEEQARIAARRSIELREASLSAGRQRRFRDTRQLKLLASELAAEALLRAPENYSTLAPETRRASMMSMLAASNGDLGTTPSNNSQSSLQYPGLAMPQPAFATSTGRSGSPIAGSSRSGSPRNGTSDQVRFETSRAAFSQSQQSLPTPTTPAYSQKGKINGLATGTMTGLGDGPYPVLPQRGLDFSDPFGIPAGNDGPYLSDQGGRNSLPGNTPQSRATSFSSASLPKRSVLQMSMHNPEAELQGLTKPIKSGRSTPFGSRAPSRQVTPNPSINNLREKANASAALLPSSPSMTTAQRKVSPAGSNISVSNQSASNKSAISVVNEQLKGRDKKEGVAAVEQGKPIEKLDDKASKVTERPAPKSRRSFFGKKASKQASDSKTKSDDAFVPPPLPAGPVPQNQTVQPADGKVHTPPQTNGSAGTVNGSSAFNFDEPKSAQTLVKVPSPTNTNTTASASSHEPGAFAAYSSDGGSNRQGFSAVTTPEAMPVKSSPPSLASLPTLPPLIVENQNSRSTSPSKLGSATPTLAGRPNPINNVASLLRPTPRSASSATKASSAGTIKKKKTFMSFFSSSKSGGAQSSAPVVSTPPPPPPQYRSNGSAPREEKLGPFSTSALTDVSSSPRPFEDLTAGQDADSNSRVESLQNQAPLQSSPKPASYEQAYVNPELTRAGFGNRSPFQAQTPMTAASSQ
ncbi:hypothetical protein CBS101457_002659 [Exobasidium rhododendri]|nr:hypothetical protein CBS101457_002659 [Exobasidium rhododendri]